jgi:hypothetical protein
MEAIRDRVQGSEVRGQRAPPSFPSSLNPELCTLNPEL